MATICVVDDDEAVRDALRLLLQLSGYTVKTYESAGSFLEAGVREGCDCLVTDIRMPDMDGLELQQKLMTLGLRLPIIVMTGHGDVPLAVRAMKAGAIDFLEKPFSEKALLQSIQSAFSIKAKEQPSLEVQEVRERLGELTAREKQVLEQIIDGHQNKMIAHNLQISVRTVEVYRGRIMDKMKARTVAELVRLVLAARP